MNLGALIRSHARNRPDAPAIVQDDEHLDYAALWRRIAACAARLLELGIQPGDRVGLCLGDHIDHLVLHYAVAVAGATILPMDHRWTAAEKQQVAAAFDARLILREADEAEVAGAENEIIGRDWGCSDPCSVPADVFQSQADRPLLVSLSSGTTGRPKGAIVTHRQMYERFVNQWVTLGLCSSDRFVSVTPLYFGAARSFCMGFLAAGATVILDPPPHKPPQLAEAIRKSGANITFLVPTLMYRLLPLASDAELLFPDLDLLIFGGSIVHGQEALDMQARLTPHLASYYATSEGGGISVLQSSDIEQHGDTVGRPAFCVEVDVVDANSEPVSRGETGRLRYRGPGVATAFLDETGNFDANSNDGWFYPGDLASVDRDGYISLRGREKEMIIRGGVNVYPAELETALRSHPEVSEAAVVGWPSPAMGEEVAAFVVVESDVRADDLHEFCKTLLAPYKLPKEIFVVDEMPKTNFGKIKKSDLVARLPHL